MARNRRWEAYHALKVFAADDDRCRRQRLLEHFGDTTPPAPSGRCCDVCDPLDWLQVADSAPGRRRGGGARSTAQAQVAGPPVDEAAFERLKRWRTERADGKPAYTVATNAVLEELLRRRPADGSQLLAIHGIGQSFVAKHGESVLVELGAIP